MQHYIIIRVTEGPREPGESTQAGHLRRRLHKLALELNINVADSLIREDRSKFVDGRPVPYKEAQQLFDKVKKVKD